jgi:hypothetical protein
MWVIKRIYPSGSHIVTFDGERLRFQNKQEAHIKCELLNAANKEAGTAYLLVEEREA